VKEMGFKYGVKGRGVHADGESEDGDCDDAMHAR